MGARKTLSMTGKFPGLKDIGFVERNLKFLEYQIDVIKPKIIITLGIYPAIMLGKLSPDILINWKFAKRFKEIVDPIKHQVKFKDHKCNCVALLHPSMRNLNLKYRKYKEFTGDIAEINILKDALLDQHIG